jgi:hypothetical protein
MLTPLNGPFLPLQALLQKIQNEFNFAVLYPSLALPLILHSIRSQSIVEGSEMYMS